MQNIPISNFSITYKRTWKKNIKNKIKINIKISQRISKPEMWGFGEKTRGF